MMYTKQGALSRGGSIGGHMTPPLLLRLSIQVAPFVELTQQAATNNGLIYRIYIYLSQENPVYDG